eukprot:10108398-Alexandrium_andersonii.AAC.1
MSLATCRQRTFGFASSPLLWPTRRPPIGFLPARSRHSAIGQTPLHLPRLHEPDLLRPGRLHQSRNQGCPH